MLFSFFFCSYFYFFIIIRLNSKIKVPRRGWKILSSQKYADDRISVFLFLNYRLSRFNIYRFNNFRRSHYVARFISRYLLRLGFLMEMKKNTRYSCVSSESNDHHANFQKKVKDYFFFLFFFFKYPPNRSYKCDRHYYRL